MQAGYRIRAGAPLPWRRAYAIGLVNRRHCTARQRQRPIVSWDEGV
ncbi:hypothetical protein AZ22_3075 [Bordetella bronchiseptica 980-2]|nr:hypothetical protein AZ22_3075 [Bordetella bronchiseptica 980-2]KDC68097.1 hypothetical protein L512_3042 [Bordetella bronchiseptica MBORD624]KDD61555.1 hypothetical protein L533_3194 [Bordetella bronchiseptica OSU553]